MARSRPSHAAWRELIAARLDRHLTRAETRTLTAHLRDCAACRQADHDYREQRALLRALPPRPAPRDLWPRTSAALDREVARGSYRGLLPWRRISPDGLTGVAGRANAPSPTLIATLAAFGVIAALGVAQLLPAFEPVPTTAPGEATPFAVAPQPLAFIGNESTDLYVYQTHVGHVCPPTAPDCQVDDNIVRTPVNLPASTHARNVALSPSGKALAVVGQGGNRDVIAVVMLAPGGDQSDQPAGSNTNPDATLSASPTPDGSSEPAGSDQPAATPLDTPNGASPLPQATATAPDASTVPGLRVLAILENVESAGAPPAWSPSGEMLAFSAMPADGSHGPDIYVWSPNEAVAQPITSDHGSYFASWSGERIVLSRVVAKPGAGQARLSTIVIDPRTLEERAVAGPALWMPVVNPAGTQAVAWRGEIDLSSGLAVPRTGTLYMIGWSAIDPFAPDNEPVATPAPSIEATPSVTALPPTDLPSAPPSDAPTTAPATEVPTAASASPSAAPPTGEPASPADTPGPAPTDTPAAPALTEQPTQPVPDGWVALDLGRDITSAPVVDWQVRWSVDGQVLGIWIADAEGSTWGRLTVLAVDPTTHQLGTADPLLAPTLARRGFSLGLSRVAWVAPSEDNPDGELRIRTWGDDGVGGLRLQPSELEEVLPAF